MIEIWQDEHPIIPHPLNKTFHEVRMMPAKQFGDWHQDVRVNLGKRWEQDGIPPLNGISPDQMERELQRLSVSRTCSLVLDEDTYERNVIAAGQGPGQTTLRRIFTNMDRVGDGNADGFSLFDFLTTTDQTTDAGGKLLRRWSNHFERNVKRDSLYQYSPQLKISSPIALGAQSGREWIKLFAASPNKSIGFWVEATKKQGKNGELFLTASELRRLMASRLINRNQIVNVLGNGADRYRLRTYKLSKRIFPAYFEVMRKSLVRSGSCFSPVIAKFLIQAYSTKGHQGGIIIYDPCVGYAGTLLGAMAAASDRPIHFIGTEPNSTNYLRPDRSRYDVLDEGYRGCVGQRHYVTFEIFRVGAEVVGELQEFQPYRGLIDVVITSTPYFCAEIYSREPTQSAIKFPTYPEWRDGFLRKTIRTCAEYVRPGGYVLWNIADISIKGRFYPLEQDSVDAMREYGLVFEEKLKMPLSHDPGGTIGTHGLPKMKNFVIFNGVHHKYEPVFVFRKPERT